MEQRLVTLRIRREIWERLYDLALAQHRSPREQAAYVLEQAVLRRKLPVAAALSDKAPARLLGALDL
jgi:hypothetical protein